MPDEGRGPAGLGHRRAVSPGGTGGRAACAEDANCARQPRLRVPGLQGASRAQATVYRPPSAAAGLTRRTSRLSPREKSVQRFQEQIRSLTRRKAPLKLREVIERINPVIRGWGHFYRKADVKRLFHRLDRWIEPRIYSFLAKHWRNPMWRQYPTRRLIAEFGLVRLTPSHPRSRPTMTPGRSSRGKRLAGKLHEPFDRADRGRAFTPHLFRLYRRSDTDTRRNPHGRTRNPPCKSKEQGTETLGLHGFEAGGLPPLKARTVPRKGRAGEEESCRVERRQGIREAARAAPGRSRG